MRSSPGAAMIKGLGSRGFGVRGLVRSLGLWGV